MIHLFRIKTVFYEINKNLDSIFKQIENNKINTDLKTKNLLTFVQQNQLHTEEILSGYNLQLDTKIIQLSKDSDKQRRSLGIALDEVRSLILLEIEEVKNKKAVENLLSVNALVESDNSTQQLLGEGSLKYKDEDFTAAVKVYKKVLDIDSSNKKALCYFNASLYYQNPGDGSTFPGIKNDLIPLLEENALTIDEKVTALNVLIGISREEGNAAPLKQYQDALQQLEEGRK